MESKTLSELYAGVLSRDWEKLLKALDRGEKRAIVYQMNISEETGGVLSFVTERIGVISQPDPIFPIWHVMGKVDALYRISGWHENDPNNIDLWLKNRAIGYFETKEDKDGN
jgi:hypothetical protein